VLKGKTGNAAVTKPAARRWNFVMTCSAVPGEGSGGRVVRWPEGTEGRLGWLRVNAREPVGGAREGSAIRIGKGQMILLILPIARAFKNL
jgi:hypothetical protein